MKSKRDLKKWLKSNEQYFRNNPQIFKTMLNNPAFLASFNELMVSRKDKLARRIARLERKAKPGIAGQPVSGRKRRFPRIKLPSLSTVNQHLQQANELIHTLKNLTGKM